MSKARAKTTAKGAADRSPFSSLDPADIAAVKAALGAPEAAANPRAGLVAHLRAVWTEDRTRIKNVLATAPHASRPVTQAYAQLTDRIVRLAHYASCTLIHPAPPKAQKISIGAVGGYGRGEMAPHSDVDLLFLTPGALSPWAKEVVETILYTLWDLRLKVGHATRTIKECVALAAEDYTIRTSLVELRHISGDADLMAQLDSRLRQDLFRTTARDFVEAKLAERAERHRKQGGQRYVVEPNVKEGKGGLRDLQSLFWIAKYLHGVKDAAELVPLGVFDADEFDTFVRAEDFLWAVRCHLHLITGRATDQLTFDMQVEVANAMGYKDLPGRRGVELFMQNFFSYATDVGELTRIFLTALEAAHVKKEPALTRFFRRKRKADPPFEILQNRLAVADEEAFLGDPLNILRLFQQGLRTGYLIHPTAMRLVRNNLNLIDNAVRTDPAAISIFFDTVLRHGNPARALRRMNELGVLAAFIPEFEPIVAMMQFNMYHSYTVDEHTIQVIDQLARIERGEVVEDLPVVSSILEAGVNRKVLYLALLLHDIGKGRPEDHSILGAKIARVVAPRFGLKRHEVETVEWLVRHHLFMSDMAQKRDIADPRTVRDFAKAVQSKKRLDLLTVLTVCDIRGVGPDTWNNWKAVLIRALYRQTARALETGLEDLNRTFRGTEAKRLLRAALPDWPKADLRVETKRHYPPYWQGLHVTAHVVFAGLLRGIADDEVRLDLEPDEDRDATRICFAMSDHPGIFARITGALALAGANVLDARTFTTNDGFVTAAFWVQDADETPFDASRLPRLKQTLTKILGGEIVARDAMRDKDRLKKREKPFRVPTHITFDNDGSEIYTIIEVDTRDRPGLLHDLTRTLAGLNISVSSAVIATYGEQAVDTFYVKDTFGLKLHSEAKQKTVEDKLRAAIAQGAERANG